MRSYYRPLFAGILLLLSAIILEQVGVHLESLGVLVLSFVCAIAGALVSIRGIVDFVSERL